jgi:hypothetical protein
MDTHQRLGDSLPLGTLNLPTIVPPDLDLAIFPRVIEHMPEFRVLYCHLCKQVCFPSSLHAHLFEIHKVKVAIRRPIVEFCQTLDLIHFLLPYTSRIQRLSRPSLARGVESLVTCTAAVQEIEEFIIAGVKLFA